MTQRLFAALIGALLLASIPAFASAAPRPLAPDGCSDGWQPVDP